MPFSEFWSAPMLADTRRLPLANELDRLPKVPDWENLPLVVADDCEPKVCAELTSPLLTNDPSFLTKGPTGDLLSLPHVVATLAVESSTLERLRWPNAPENDKRLRVILEPLLLPTAVATDPLESSTTTPHPRGCRCRPRWRG
jgi:hypothetical protein